MKRTAWHLTAIGGTLLLAAGSLRAQTPETLPAPNGKTSSILQENAPPPLDSWFDSSSQPQPNSQSKSVFDGEHAVSAPADMANAVEGVGPAPNPKPFDASSGYWWRNGCWYGDFDFVVWDRSRPKGQLLGFEVNEQAQALTGNSFNARGQDLPVEPGARGTLGYFLDRDMDNRDHSVEVTYLGFNNWESTDSNTVQTPGDDFRSSPAFPGFDRVETYNTAYRSSLQSLELDYRVRNRPGRDQLLMGPDGFWSRHLTTGRTESAFVGLRGISEEEMFNWTAIASGTQTADLQINTKNHLLGFQVGGDCYDVHESWYWGIKGDAGIYCNFSNGATAITSVLVTTPVNGSATNQTASFFGELGFVVGYEINPHLLVHTGWDLALLGGIASAPDDASETSVLAANTPFLLDKSQIFFNGLSLGVEAYW